MNIMPVEGTHRTFLFPMISINNMANERIFRAKEILTSLSVIS
jgi:hypothetical protein